MNFTHSYKKTAEFEDVSDEIWERSLVADPESTVALRGEIGRIANKVLSRPDTLIKDARPIISAHDGISARICANMAASPYVVSKGLLSSAKTEDQIAFVIFHELAHRELRLRADDPKAVKGRADENGADRLATQWILEEGYNWSQIVEFFKVMDPEILNSYQPSELTIAHSHSPTTERIKHVHTYVAEWIDKNKKPAPTPAATRKPKVFSGDLDYVTHTSFIEAYLEFVNYSTLSKADKATALASIPEQYLESSKRVKDFVRELQRLEYEEHTLSNITESRRVFRSAMDKIFEDVLAYEQDEDHKWRLPDIIDGIHWAVYGQSTRYGQNQVYPFGRMVGLNIAAQRFIDARSKQQASDAARNFLEVLDACTPVLQRPIAQRMFQKSFRFSSDDAEAFPWDRHIEAMQSLANADRLTVAKALYVLGADNDKRIWDILSVEELEDISHTGIIAVPQGREDYFSIRAYPGRWPDERKDDGGRLYNQWSESDRFYKRYVMKRKSSVDSSIPKIEELNELADYGRYYDALFAQAITAKERGEDPKIYVQRFLDDVTVIARDKPDGRDLANKIFTSYVIPHPLRGYEVHIPEAFFNVARPAINGYDQNLIIRFVLDNELNLFTFQDKLSVIRGLRLENSRLYADKTDLPWHRNALGYKRPKTMDELVRLETMLTREESDNAIFLDELYEFAERLSPPPISEDMHRIVSMYDKNVRRVIYMGRRPEHNLEDDGKKVIKAICQPTGDLGAIRWDISPSIDAHSLIELYQHYEDMNIIPNMTVRENIMTAIQSRIAAMPTGQQRIDTLEYLLYGKTQENEHEQDDEYRRYSPALLQRPKHTPLRQWAIKTWAEEQKQQFGLDDGSPEYLDHMKPVIDKASHYSSAEQCGDMLHALADAIVAQREVSYYYESLIQGRKKLSNPFDYMVAHLKISGVEDVLRKINATAERRDRTLTFLTSTATEQACLEYATFLREESIKEKRQYHEESRLYNIRHGYPPVEEFNKTDEEIFPYQNRHYVAWRLKDAHDYFWSQDLRSRTLALDYILISGDDILRNQKTAYAKAAATVNDKLFPLDVPLSEQERLYTDFARKMVESYIRVSQPPERSLLLAAMMAANLESNSTGQRTTVGERIALFLEIMGPAYIKLGQGADSHPSTPQELKQHLGRLKGRANPPKRPEFWHRFDDTVPQFLIDQTAYIGPVEGSASFNIAASTKFTNGEELMFAYLRSQAKDHAEFGYNKLIRCARDLAKRNPQYADALKPMIEMIKHARDMTATETDLHVGAKQSEVAQTLYGGVSCEVRGQSFDYVPMAWRYYGDEFRFMQIGKGLHFSELPEVTPEEQEYKQGVAVTAITVELMNYMRGGSVDIDPHGAQMRITGNTISRFDWGGIILELPKEREKRELVAIVSNLIESAQKSEGANSLVGTIAQNIESNSDYITHFRVSLLALGDYTNFLARIGTLQSDLINIATTLLTSKEMDKTIRRELTKRHPFLLAGAKLKNRMGSDGISLLRETYTAPYQPVYVGAAEPSTPSVPETPPPESGNDGSVEMFRPPAARLMAQRGKRHPADKTRLSA